MLGFLPRDISLYRQALLHRSSGVRTGEGHLINNERLEFLGDAILDAVVADILYRRFKGKREGFLTNTRSKIVQRETLNKLAIQIGLDKLVKFTTRSHAHNSYMYGNAFEALIGAIYLDCGYDGCKRFFEKKILRTYIDLEDMSQLEVNFKSRLIEWSQKQKIPVSFELIHQSTDSAGSPVFRTEVHVAGLVAGQGSGYSKKESQQVAAHETLLKLKNDPAFSQAVAEASLALPATDVEAAGSSVIS